MGVDDLAGISARPLLRGLFAASAAAAVAEVEAHVSASGGPFMAGGAPDAADALMATVLLLAHNLAGPGGTDCSLIVHQYITATAAAAAQLVAVQGRTCSASFTWQLGT